MPIVHRDHHACAAGAGLEPPPARSYDAENSRARNQRLRQQVSALEQRLSEALGRQVADALSGQELLDDPVETLRADFAGAQQRVFELKEALAEAGEELTAVREINHELLARANRAGG